MKFSLRVRLVLSYLLLIGFLALASGLLLFNYFKSEYESQYRVNTFTQGSIVSNAIRYHLDRPSIVIEEIKELSRQFSLRILIIGMENRVILDSQSGQANDLTGEIINHGEIITALQGNSSAQIYSTPDYGEVMYSAIPIFREEQVIGAVFLSKSLNEFSILKNQILNRILLSTGLGSLITVIFSVIFASYLTKPLNKLTRASGKLAEGNLAYRVDYKSKDEFGQLADTFNKMAEELENQDIIKRRFIADASHEIRTPLSTIKILVQSLQNSKDLDKDKVNEFLADMNMEIDRLSTLVNNLLELTRLESQKEKIINFEVVELDSLIRKICHRFNILAQEKNIKVLVDVPKIKVSSEYTSLFRIIHNLVENAIKYTPSGGIVEIILLESDDRITLTIKDSGVGITHENLQKVFDRFYRVDGARTGAQGGFGLGLSLVKELSSRLNIDISVESQLGKGTKFTLYLPKANY
ncbi:MAG: hypothetical protein APF76_14540 [Desulfitibacter sp. BRH_c19]|nr:MAG: hypothetical protein APF76_14540 [Desulfitibacter sp. BRH_c19]